MKTFRVNLMSHKRHLFLSEPTLALVELECIVPESLKHLSERRGVILVLGDNDILQVYLNTRQSLQEQFNASLKQRWGGRDAEGQSVGAVQALVYVQHCHLPSLLVERKPIVCVAQSQCVEDLSSRATQRYR